MSAEMIGVGSSAVMVNDEPKVLAFRLLGSFPGFA